MKKKQLRNLLDMLRASNIDGRIGRQNRSAFGVSLPQALLWLQAHELLLHAAARHQLLPTSEVARTEAELARLRSIVKFGPKQE